MASNSLSLRILGGTDVGPIDGFDYYEGEERSVTIQIMNNDTEAPYAIPSGVSNLTIVFPGSDEDVSIALDEDNISDDRSIIDFDLSEENTVDIISGFMKVTWDEPMSSSENSDIQILSSTEIDGTELDTIDLYTVPADTNAIPTGIILRSATLASITSHPTISIGSNDDADDIADIGAISLEADKNYSYQPNQGAVIASDGQVIKLNVSVAAVATTYEFIVDLIGYNESSDNSTRHRVAYADFIQTKLTTGD